jgi:hypothetical protein
MVAAPPIKAAPATDRIEGTLGTVACPSRHGRLPFSARSPAVFGTVTPPLSHPAPHSPARQRRRSC